MSIWTPTPSVPLDLGIPGVTNLWQVKPGIYRSAQPPPGAWPALAKALKLTTVLCLRTDGELNADLTTHWSRAEEIAAVSAVPLNTINIQMNPLTPPFQGDLSMAVSALARESTLETGEPGILVHCSRGRDRTGVSVAALQLTCGAHWSLAFLDFWKAQQPDPLTAEWWDLLALYIR